MSVVKRRPSACWLVALALCLPPIAAAQSGGAGDLLVAPTRVVLEGSTRSAAITLRNVGLKPALYRLSLQHFQMDAEGRITPVEGAAPEASADALLRFSPRQVLLAPGESQVVRLAVQRPAGLAEGEYRSHLTFQAMPDMPSADAEPARHEGWSIRLEPVYGVSIPVIVRHGHGDSSVAILSSALEPAAGESPAALRVTLARSGSESSFGDVEIVRGTARREEIVARVRGVAIWTPNESRAVRVPLPATAPSEMVGVGLSVRYLDRGTGESVSVPLGR